MENREKRRFVLGWLGRLGRTSVAAARSYSERGGSQQAAAISFRVLFSLVPLIALIVSVVDLLLPEDRREQLTQWILGSLSASPGLEDSIRRALAAGGISSSVAGLVAVVGLLWGATGMMGAIRRAFATIWDEAGRPFVRGKLLDLALVFGTSFVVLVGFALGLLVQAIAGLERRFAGVVGLDSTEITFLSGTTSAAATSALVFGCLLVLYRTAAPVRPRWAALWPGALVGAAGFELATVGYREYLARFKDLSVIYGSLGALLGFMLVVYVGAAATIFGAAIVARWPERRPRPAAAVTEGVSGGAGAQGRS